MLNNSSMINPGSRRSPISQSSSSTSESSNQGEQLLKSSKIDKKRKRRPGQQQNKPHDKVAVSWNKTGAVVSKCVSPSTSKETQDAVSSDGYSLGNPLSDVPEYSLVAHVNGSNGEGGSTGSGVSPTLESSNKDDIHETYEYEMPIAPLDMTESEKAQWLFQLQQTLPKRRTFSPKVLVDVGKNISTSKQKTPGLGATTVTLGTTKKPFVKSQLSSTTLLPRPPPPLPARQPLLDAPPPYVAPPPPQTMSWQQTPRVARSKGTDDSIPKTVCVSDSSPLTVSGENSSQHDYWTACAIDNNSTETETESRVRNENVNEGKERPGKDKSLFNKIYLQLPFYLPPPPSSPPSPDLSSQASMLVQTDMEQKDVAFSSPQLFAPISQNADGAIPHPPYVPIEAFHQHICRDHQFSVSSLLPHSFPNSRETPPVDAV